MQAAMLRAVVPSSRTRVAGSFGSVVRAQWVLQAARAGPARLRTFADDRKTTDQHVLPGSQSANAPSSTRVPGLSSPVPPTPASTATIAPENMPKVPPPPPSTVQTTVPPTPLPPSPGPSTVSTPPPPPPKRRRRFRNFLLLTTTTLVLAYAGGIYYALSSDSFHDFFTDYVPGAEEAVLFFEEREFKRRFPHGVNNSKLYPQVSGENKVTISGRSGASVRNAEGSSKSSNTASTTSAADDKLGKTDRAVSSKAGSSEAASADKSQSKPSPAAEKKAGKVEPEQKKSESAPAPAKSGPVPTSAAPIAQIDNISGENTSDPAVQKATKMLNDIITMVNADNASGKYSATLDKAKGELKQIASELAAYRASHEAAAKEQIKRNDAEFDKAAKDMLEQVQQEQKEQELRWREEYENERARLSQTFDDKLRVELEGARKVAEQRLHNQLLEQNLKLQDSFAHTIRQQVETERGARLSKLKELSTAVSELESLTTKWNDIVDANVRTQHLVVAVDAVRTALNSADRPTPFLHELAALKETSNDNGIVNAAIASIHPTTYQRGIPTPGQLIDRFRHVAGEVRKAALLPEDAGIASHAASFILSKVLFKKQGLATGDDVESILTRTETLLEEGDLDEATREMNGLTGWARVLSQDWLTDCRRVLEVRQAVDVMSTEAKLQSLMVE